MQLTTIIVLGTIAYLIFKPTASTAASNGSNPDQAARDAASNLVSSAPVLIPLLPTNTGNPIIDQTNAAINISLKAAQDAANAQAGIPEAPGPASLTASAGTPELPATPTPTKISGEIIISDPVQPIRVVQAVAVSDQASPTYNTPAVPVHYSNPAAGVIQETAALRAISGDYPIQPLWSPGQGPLVHNPYMESDSTAKLLGDATDWWVPTARYIGDNPNGGLIGYVYYTPAQLRSVGLL